MGGELDYQGIITKPLGMNVLAVAAEAVSFTAGAAGTTGIVSVDKRPILNSDFGLIGKDSDTSFAFITGTVLTNEEPYNSNITDTAQLAELDNGDYRIDYFNGRIFYCKDTAGVGDTCNYSTLQVTAELIATAVAATMAAGAVAAGAFAAGSIVDGAILTVGNLTDAKSTATDGTSTSLMAVLKEISYMEQNPASRVVTLADGVTAANKADINDANTARTVGTHVVAVQNVCEDGQVGCDILGQINEGQTRTTKAEGECDKVSLTGWRELRTKDQRQLDLANCNDFTDYAALSNDTLNLADSLDHVFGTGSITFDKVNGADNKKYAGVDNTFTAINFSEIFEAGGFVGVGCKIPDITDVDYVFVRIGTDASNYNEWQMSSGNLTAAEWMALRMPTAAPDAYLGNGWNQAAVTYICFGVMFKVETDAQAGIVFDNVHIVGGRVTDSMSNTDPSVSQNINIAKVRGTRVPVNSGNKSDGCQRVVLATDDINMAAINSVQGAKTDAASTATDATSISVMQVLKQISKTEQAPVTRAVTNAGSFAVQDTPAAVTTFIDQDVDNTKQALKGTAGTLYKIDCYNSNAFACFLHFYNTDTVTVGTTVPVYTIFVPAQGAASIDFSSPLNFDTIINYAATVEAKAAGTDPTVGLLLSAAYL